MNKNTLVIALIFVATLLSQWSVAAEKQNKYRPPNDAVDTYLVKKIEGFTIRVSHRLKPFPEKTKAVLEEVQSQLRLLTPLMNAENLKKMQSVEIWIEHNFPRRTQYHSERKWLVANGYNPAKAGTIEIPKIEEFLAWRNRPVNTLLHELAHAYHDQFLGWDEPRIIEAYNAAKKSGKYKSVMRDKGYSITHYAIGNHKEYFAECTEAFLWVNDYYPFVYGELKQFDPKAFALMEKIWGPRFKPSELPTPKK